MSCESIQPLLMDYLADELDENQQEKVQAHLNACHACQSVSERYQYLLHEKNRWQDEPVPDWPIDTTVMFRPSQPFNIFKYAQVFALLLVGSLLLFNTNIYYKDQVLMVSFGDTQTNQFVDKKFIEEKLNQLEQRQLTLLKASMATLKLDQRQESERLVNVLLDYVEQDRQRDLIQLVDYIESQRQLDQSETDLAVNYLLRSQLQDEQTLTTLNQLIRYNQSQQGEDE